MGYVLTSNSNQDNYILLNLFAWRKLLELSLMFGWQPIGTLPPPICEDRNCDLYYDPNEWDGKYCVNAGQIVCDEDAQALANALEKSLNHLPDESNDEVLFPLKKFSHLSGDELNKAVIEFIDKKGNGLYQIKEDVDPLFFYSGDGKETIIELIDFFRKGAFNVR